MRKLILFIFGIVLCCSCSSYDSCQDASASTSEEVVNTSQVYQLQGQIDSLNNVMFEKEYQTRGLRKFFKRLYAAVIGDAVGGLFGLLYGGPVTGVVTSVTASGIMATKKDELRNAFIVGNASYQLWNTEE